MIPIDKIRVTTQWRGRLYWVAWTTSPESGRRHKGTGVTRRNAEKAARRWLKKERRKEQSKQVSE